MSLTSGRKIIIGNYEYITLVDQGIQKVPAKIDTGAYRSAIWATKITENNDGTVSFYLFGPSSEFYDGTRLTLPIDRQRNIRSSSGHEEIRFVVKLQIELGGKHVTGSFSLANRSSHAFPVLIGRRTLYNKYIVDVTKGIEPPPSTVKQPSLLSKFKFKRVQP